jgi:hypothetical protein
VLMAGLVAMTALPHPSLAGTPSQADISYVSTCLVAAVNGEEMDHPGLHLNGIDQSDAQGLATQLMQHYGSRRTACESAAASVMNLVTELEGK